MGEDAELTKNYNKAWELYQARCLWNVRREPHPTPEQARFVANKLRQYGDMEARKLASQIETAANRVDERFVADPAGLVVSNIRSRFATDAEAWIWYGTQELIGFDGKTPAQMVAEGRVRDVLEYINAIDAGVYS
jgi:hypothetical protein